MDVGVYMFPDEVWRHLLAVVVLLAGCTLAVTVPPTEAPPSPSAAIAVPSASPPTPSRPPSASPNLLASPSPSESASPSAISGPRQTPSATLTPVAATVPPAATASLRPTPGRVRNEGQIALADLPPGRSTFTGEAGPAPAVTTGSHETLGGAALDGADIRCVRREARSGLCVSVRIVTGLVRLENGQRYELALDSEAVADLVATGLCGATPHVVSISATQYELTVVFDRPMLHAGDCGMDAWAFTTPGTIEHVRGALGFPAPPGSYTSSSPAYAAFLTAFVSQAKVAPDCATVTFGSGWGGPIGTFDVTVAGVLDLDGNPVEPRTATVTIADEGPPRLWCVRWTRPHSGATCAGRRVGSRAPWHASRLFVP